MPTSKFQKLADFKNIMEDNFIGYGYKKEMKQKIIIIYVVIRYNVMHKK